MEKRKARYDLAAVKAAVRQYGIASFTTTARLGATRLGLTQACAVDIVLGLQRGMLFKSMTTHADCSVWQDVYRSPCPNGKLAYIKITLQAGAVVIQFKEA